MFQAALNVEINSKNEKYLSNLDKTLKSHKRGRYSAPFRKKMVKMALLAIFLMFQVALNVEIYTKNDKYFSNLDKILKSHKRGCYSAPFRKKMVKIALLRVFEYFRRPKTYKYTL